MSLRTAFAESINSVAVQLSEQVGRGRVIGVAKNMMVAAVAPYAVDIDFYFENFGDVTISALSLDEDLDAVFGAGAYTVTAGPNLVSGPAGFAVNSGFDGSADTELLSGGALGSAETCVNSILCLRKRGRHVQVGLLAGDDHRPPLPMEFVIGRELEIVGSHGMQASKYDEMLAMILEGKLDPQRLIGKTVGLDEAPAELEAMNRYENVGMTVIDRFG